MGLTVARGVRVGSNGKRKSGARSNARRREGQRPPAQARTSGNTATLPRGATLAPQRPARGNADTASIATAPQAVATPWTIARLDLLLIALFIVGGVILYMARIEDPPKYSYDEVYHAYTAAQYAIGNADAWLWSTQAPIPGVAYEWTHPPLGKLLMTIGILIWGDTPLGWRFMSAVFGALGLGAVYLLGLRLTGQRLVALGAATLTLVDGLYFVESRTGVIDIFGTVFMVCAFIGFYAFMTAPPARVRTPLLLLGFFMGLAIATKWNAVYPAVLLGAVAVWRTYGLLTNAARRIVVALAALVTIAGVLLFPLLRIGSGLKIVLIVAVVLIWQGVVQFRGPQQQARARAQGGTLSERLKEHLLAPPPPTAEATASGALTQHLIWVPLALVVLPLVLYGASYIPFFAMGHTIAQLRELQWQMYYYHSHLVATHPYSSKWYEWPLVWRPVYYAQTLGANGVSANTYANGNPLLYWFYLPATIYVTIRWWLGRHPALPVLLIGFFGQWLPWALIPRLAYIYHFLPASIFGTLAVAVAVNDLWQWGRRIVPLRAVAVGYVAIVVVAFIYFYPIYASVNLTGPELQDRIWIPSWR
jgi:dolichyl-phosphate-mannose-protein mannosyltransferase